jgi:hypothetical protein
MAVQGFNVDPQSYEPVIGVDTQENNDGSLRASIYIDEGYTQAEINLSVSELRALAVRINSAIRLLEQANH